MTPARTLMLLLMLTLALAACGKQEAGEETAAAPPPMAPAEAEDACVVTPPEEPVACTMEYDPVCGCDGKTYGNACMAAGAGVPRFEPGECGASER